MARAPVSKTGGWGFESLHSCQLAAALLHASDEFRHNTGSAKPDIKGL